MLAGTDFLQSYYDQGLLQLTDACAKENYNFYDGDETIRSSAQKYSGDDYSSDMNIGTSQTYVASDAYYDYCIDSEPPTYFEGINQTSPQLSVENEISPVLLQDNENQFAWSNSTQSLGLNVQSLFSPQRGCQLGSQFNSQFNSQLNPQSDSGLVQSFPWYMESDAAHLHQVPGSPRLPPDVSRFSPFEHWREEGAILEAMFPANVEIPKRPGHAEMHDIEMNRWQQTQVALAIAGIGMGESDNASHDAFSRPTPYLGPDLYSKNGASLTGNADLGFHPIYGVCRRSERLEKELNEFVENIPKYIDHPPANSSSTKATKDGTGSEKKKSKPKVVSKHNLRYGESIKLPDPAYTKASKSKLDGTFLNFRVDKRKVPKKFHVLKGFN